MGIFTRYLFRSHTLAFISVSLIIAAIVMVNFFDHLLEDVASGLLDSQYVLPLFSMGFVRYVGVAMGAGACIGGIYITAQMNQRNEIVALLSSGFSQRALLGRVMLIGLWYAALAAAAFLYVIPKSEQIYDQNYQLARQSAESRLLEAGSFTNIQGLGTMYVETFDKNTAEFTNSFFSTESPKTQQIRVTVAKTGSMISTPTALLIDKYDGQNYQLLENKLVESLSFEKLELEYPRSGTAYKSVAKIEQTSTVSLVNNMSSEPHQKELGSRLGQIWFVFNNTLLFALLFFTKPRRSQLLLIIGLVLIHLVYRYGTEHILKIPALIHPTLWLLSPHAIFLAGFLLIWQYKVWRW